MKKIILALLLTASTVFQAADNAQDPSENLLQLIKNDDNIAETTQRQQIWDLLNMPDQQLDTEPSFTLLKRMDKKNKGRCRSIYLTTSILPPVGTILATQFPVPGIAIVAFGIFKTISLVENYATSNPQRILQLLELAARKQELVQAKKTVDAQFDIDEKNPDHLHMVAMLEQLNAQTIHSQPITLDGIKTRATRPVDIDIELIDWKAEVLIGK